MASLRDRWNAAITAFRDPYLAPTADDPAAYDAADARRFRYALFRALYDSSVYRAGVHGWATTYRQQFGLYKYIRAIEASPAAIVGFWQTYLFGGSLDPNAGDGQGAPSAIPIQTNSRQARQLRIAIAQLWQWSNWPVQKDQFGLMGARDGDAALLIRDDVARGKVALEVLDPALVSELTLDPFGNVRGYTIEEQRAHPDTGKAVVYRETVTRDGENVIYTTWLNDAVYAWPGNVDARGEPRASWTEPYGFVPLVWVKHISVGTVFGRSELHQGLAMFREVDDVASALDDQIRKSVAAPWLMAGVDDPKKTRGGVDPTAPTATPSATNPQSGRQEVPIFYGPVGATATPLVAPLDIAGVNDRIERMHAKLRREYPELDADIVTSAGDASGRALRVARQRAEAKVALRRAAYDDALVRAHQMAISIAGMRRLPGFQGFSLDSYRRGDLDHAIGSRPVFARSTLDEVEEDMAFWQAAEQAVKAGVQLAGYLRDKGWSEERIVKVVGAPAQVLDVRSVPALELPARGSNGLPRE